MARPQGRTIDEASPGLDVVLPDGSRLHAVMPPITRRYTQVAIRKFTRRARRLDDLAESGTFTPSWPSPAGTVGAARVTAPGVAEGREAVVMSVGPRCLGVQAGRWVWTSVDF